MAVRGRGTVVAISSDAAAEAYPGWGAYAVSKAALDHLVRVWSAELEAAGVRFLSVDPGEMDTAMHAAALPDARLKPLEGAGQFELLPLSADPLFQPPLHCGTHALGQPQHARERV